MKWRLVSLTCAFLLVGSMILTSCQRNETITSKDLMSDVNQVKMTDSNLNIDTSTKEEGICDLTEFSTKLLQVSYEGDNLLLSPLSIVSALGMLANGAEEETLIQLEEVLQVDRDTLNKLLKNYSSQAEGYKENKLHLANSIWIRKDNDLTIHDDFLRSNKMYYDASVYETPFDNGTVRDINNWVNKETEGMIPSLLNNELPKDAVMYLINALYLEAKWSEPYKKRSVTKGTFTTEENAEEKVDFMVSEEDQYLELSKGQGFIKDYERREFAFVALLPNEGVTMDDFIGSLDTKELSDAIKKPKPEDVLAKLPKFSVECSTLLNDPLKTLGMTDAFSPAVANLTSLGEYVDLNLFVSRVIHKTKMVVDTVGTKAGAVTAMEVTKESSKEVETKPHKIILDRPFLFMIIDKDEAFPIFIGTYMGEE